MNRNIILISIATVVLVCPAVAAGDSLTRAEFAARFGTIQSGMSESHVITLLGKPDDIVTGEDDLGLAENHAIALCYGTSGHLTFPTLGAIFLDNGKVISTSGGQGNVPPAGMFTETELRRLLTFIDQSRQTYDDPENPVPFMDVGIGQCGPATLIRIVNALLPLGKDKALAALEEYCRVVGDNENIFLILHALFNVPKNPGYMPIPLIGAPEPPQPADPRLAPRYPLVIIDDVPLVVAGGYMMGGYPEPAVMQVDYFRKHGQLRSAPLKPKGDPLDLPDEVDALGIWSAKHIDDGFYGPNLDAMWKQEGRTLIERQVMELVGARASNQVQISTEDQWTDFVHKTRPLQLRWDVSTQSYVGADGKPLQSRPSVRYKVETWECKTNGYRLYIHLHRTDPHTVDLDVDAELPAGNGLSQSELGVVRIFVRGLSTPLWSTPIPPSGAQENTAETSGSMSETDLTIKEGSLVEVQCQQNGGALMSRVFTP